MWYSFFHIYGPHSFDRHVLTCIQVCWTGPVLRMRICRVSWTRKTTSRLASSSPGKSSRYAIPPFTSSAHHHPFWGISGRMLAAVCDRVRTSAIADSRLCLFVALFPPGSNCNCLPTRSSTCARKRVARKLKGSARKSSRVKWRELPPVS